LFHSRNQFWEPIPVPSLVSRELSSRLQLPLTTKAVYSSTAHYHWQLVLMLPPTTGESISYARWLKSMLSVDPPSVSTSCTTPVELLSLSNNQQIQVIVKVWYHCSFCILVLCLFFYSYFKDFHHYKHRRNVLHV